MEIIINHDGLSHTILEVEDMHSNDLKQELFKWMGKLMQVSLNKKIKSKNSDDIFRRKVSFSYPLTKESKKIKVLHTSRGFMPKEDVERLTQLFKTR